MRCGELGDGVVYCGERGWIDGDEISDGMWDMG